MNLDYSERGVIKDLMIEYLQKVLYEFPEEFRGTSVTPEVDHLFQIRGSEEAD